MKKYFIHNVIVSLLLSSSALLAMEPEAKNPASISKKCAAHFAAEVKEINPYLFIAQKASDFYTIYHN